MENSKFKFPTETIELPSKGLLYPSDHPLHSGKVEMKYMTAKEEDILTNQNYIKQGVVIDKLLQSLLITKFNYDDLLVGDKNAIMVAARVLGYGKDYSFTYDSEELTVDLSSLPVVELDESLLVEEGVNEFGYTLPHSGNQVTFRLVDGKLDKAIDAEVKGIKRVNKNVSPEMSTRLKHQIISVNGETDPKTVRDFVDNALLARDASSLRTYMKSVNPDIKMTFIHEGNNGEEEVAIPLQVQFFWPDARV
jgi:hypothetical protein